jgi:hypothetical protein
MADSTVPLSRCSSVHSLQEYDVNDDLERLSDSAISGSGFGSRPGSTAGSLWSLDGSDHGSRPSSRLRSANSARRVQFATGLETPPVRLHALRRYDEEDGDGDDDDNDDDDDNLPVLAFSARGVGVLQALNSELGGSRPGTGLGSLRHGSAGSRPGTGALAAESAITMFDNFGDADDEF